MQLVSWSEAALDSHLHFQICDFGKQYYIWVAADSTNFGNLHVAVPTPGAVPPAATLVSSGPLNNGSAVAQRLSEYSLFKIPSIMAASASMSPAMYTQI